MSKEKNNKTNKVNAREVEKELLTESEKEQIQDLLDDGWKIGGVIDKDTTDEEIEEMANRIAEEMIKETGGIAE